YEFAVARGVTTRARVLISVAVWGSVLLMATTSNELGGRLVQPEAHKIAQGYGMFLWAGVALYLATAWRVWVERDHIGDECAHTSNGPMMSATALPAPHHAPSAMHRLSERA